MLIRKNRPAWQKGKLNGIGGKLEPGETPLDAMRREFWEEAGVRVENWKEAVVLTGQPTPADPRGWQGHFFRAIATKNEFEQCTAQTDEALEVSEAARLPSDTIPNLRWIIPLMLEDEVVENRTYSVKVL